MFMNNMFILIVCCYYWRLTLWFVRSQWPCLVTWQKLIQ